MGSFEVQVFVSLVVVLGAAMVALICDYLKGSNERLRERNAQLQARQQELEQLVDRLESQHHAMRQEKPREKSRDKSRRERPVHTVAPAVAAVAEAVLAQTGAAPLVSPLVSVTAQAQPAEPVIATPRFEVPAIAATAPEPVVMAEAVVAEATSSRRTVRSFGFDLDVANELLARHSVKSLKQITSELKTAATRPAPVVAETIAETSVEPVVTVEPVSIQVKTNVVELPVVPVVAAAETKGAISEVQVPGGHFNADALDELLAAHGVFHGLVVVVNVTTRGELEQESQPHYDRLMSSITRTIRSLGRDQDFTARSAEDEFVLIFPRETGTAAQRRIQQVSERLWDFQLRALGAYSVLFSWGAEESDEATLTGLIEAARTQIRESRTAQQEAVPAEAAAM